MAMKIVELHDKMDRLLKDTMEHLALLWDTRDVKITYDDFLAAVKHHFGAEMVQWFEDDYLTEKVEEQE